MDWQQTFNYNQKLWEMGLIDGYSWGKETLEAMGMDKVHERALKFAKHVGINKSYVQLGKANRRFDLRVCPEDAD